MLIGKDKRHWKVGHIRVPHPHSINLKESLFNQERRIQAYLEPVKVYQSNILPWKSLYGWVVRHVEPHPKSWVEYIYIYNNFKGASRFSSKKNFLAGYIENNVDRM